MSRFPKGKMTHVLKHWIHHRSHVLILAMIKNVSFDHQEDF
jgi:hypothetical protein